jgi:biopolymer transport protein ExbD
MSMFRKSDHSIPALNTASLPDLIFVVLFFFMIVTHIREVPLKVEYQTPSGQQLERLTKKSTVSYIYIGKPLNPSQGSGYCIQLNDKLAGVDEIKHYIEDERSRMSAADVQSMTVSIKADRDVPMGIVTDVKQALREAGALNINYAAVLSDKKR